MKVINRMKVVRVTINGEVGYLRSPSIFGEMPTWSPFEATNYLNNDQQLTIDVGTLVLPGDGVWAKSGLRVDAAEIVELEVSLNEVSAVTAREPRAY